MNLYKSKTYIEDLEYTIKNTPVLEKLNSSSVFITGATGLICSAVADLLFRYNEIYDAGITVLVAARSQERAEQRFSRYESSPYFRFIQYDATGKNDLKNRLPEHIDYIIHGASNSAPKDIQSHAVDTMLDNFTALYELLSYAEETGVQSTLFISSSEVYGNKETAEPYREDQYGYVDILNPRSSYSSGKRAGETLCSCFSAERGVRTVIVRPGHIYGPTAKRTDSHVSSAFAFDAAEGKSLVMKSVGLQLRSYCYSLDAATAILTALLKGTTASAYNISNPKSVITIRQMVAILAEAGHVNVTFVEPSEMERLGYNPMQNSSLNGEKLLELGWRGRFDADIGVKHTVQIIKESE